MRPLWIFLVVWHLFLNATTETSIVVYPGDKLNILVSKSPLEQGDRPLCAWAPPDYQGDSAEILQLEPGKEEENDYPGEDPLRPKGTWTYKWYGRDPKTDCGIEVKSAAESDHGSWKCHLGGTTEFDVIIPYPPKTTLIKNDFPQEDKNEIMAFNTVEDSMPINISCFSTKSRPPPTVRWRIDNKQVYDKDILFVKHKETEESESFTDSEFIMTYRPKPADDGLKLGCTFAHMARDYSEIPSENPNAPNRFVTLAIEGPPDTDSFRFEFSQFNVGERGVIKCYFHSNPPPQKGDISWRIQGIESPIVSELYESKEVSRYTSTLSSLKDNDYVSTLTIDNLKTEDLDQEMFFEAKNKLGSGSKQFRVPEPDVSMSGGAIAGLTIGIILFVILIALLGFFVYQKKKKSAYNCS